MAAADRELTGHRWHPSIRPDEYEYVGRRHMLFVVERDMHRGGRRLAAACLSASTLRPNSERPPGEPACSCASLGIAV